MRLKNASTNAKATYYCISVAYFAILKRRLDEMIGTWWTTYKRSSARQLTRVLKGLELLLDQPHEPHYGL